jgi:hypothetical protein
MTENTRLLARSFQACQTFYLSVSLVVWQKVRVQSHKSSGISSQNWIARTIGKLFFSSEPFWAWRLPRWVNCKKEEISVSKNVIEVFGYGRQARIEISGLRPSTVSLESTVVFTLN